MPHTHVRLARQELLVVRPHVQDDRQDCPRAKPRRRDVQVELPDTDPQPIRPQIAETQNPTAVCHDDRMHVFRPVVHHRGHLPTVLRREEHPTGTPIQLVIVPTHVPHRGRVHHARHLGKVVHQQPVEQRLVPVLQVAQHRPLAQVVVGDARRRRVLIADRHLDVALRRVQVALHVPFYLLFERADLRRQQAAQAHSLPLGQRVAGSFVQARVVEHPHAPELRYGAVGDVTTHELE